MEQSEFDFETFARLRGKECKSAVNWPMLASLILFLAGLFLLLSQKTWTAI